MTRMAKIERKTEYFPIVGCDIKATNDAQGIVEGYLNYIGNIDYGDDRTLTGAFKRTIADSYARKTAQGLDFLWPYLWNHDYNQIPPGGIFEANEDKNGLYIKTQFNIDIQAGRELYSSFKLGTLKKQSMGYKAIRYDYVKENGRSIRNLIEVAIVEGSAVVFPMNDLAAVEVVKNATNKRTFIMPGTQQEPQKKDFNVTYQERMQNDWLDDLWMLFSSLQSEIITAFQIGDQPVADCQAALDQFSQAMLAYVQQGVDLGMVEVLQPDDDDQGSYGWMSDDRQIDGKAGRVLSDKNHQILTKAVGGIEGHCKQIKSLLTAAQQQGYANTMSADDPPHVKQDSTEDDAVSTHLNELLSGLIIQNTLKKK